MSLLKLATRLRAHDWMAAVIELVIVIVGILIALQVTNWNQERLDRTRGDNYHRRIQIELGEDIRAIDTTVAYWKQVSGYGYAATEHAETGKLVDGSNWKTVLAYYQASQIMPFQLDDTSFVEMRDSGDLALIADEELRKHLSRYYRLTSGGAVGYLLRHDPVYRVQLRGLTPDSVQEYVWSHCFRQLEGTNQELIDCPSPISEESAAGLLQSYRGAAGLLENLRFWTSTMRVSSLVLNGARGEAVTLVADIDAALAR